MARAKKLTLSIYQTRLVFTFRRFKTQKANRSKKTKQLVLPLYGLPYREVAIVKSRRTGRRKKRQMLSRPSLVLLAVGVVGISYFGFHLKNEPEIKLVSKHTSSEVKQVENKHLSRSIPTRIQIESIGLDAPLAQVGLKADDSLQVPNDPSMAGWYTGSPTPGEVGPAIIDGHVDKIGGIAIFWRLRELKPGDIIEIDRADGNTAKFKVDSLEQFAQADFPSQKIYGNINHAGLRLITCGGIFNPQTGHYSDNIVVFGSLTD